MMDILGVCYRFFGEFLQAFVALANGLAQFNAKDAYSKPSHAARRDDLASRALTAVFGMDAEGRIKKEKARRVVERLGLIAGEDEFGFELVGVLEEELRSEEIVGCGEEEDEDGLLRGELMRRAFLVFDENGDGFIEALEVKRVLECLGLGNGWDIGEIERMVEVVDLNFDGKVDFSEFELMMGGK
ncbi:calmodulin-like protein 2 [Tasmannia lanceolata]|uniref:calmodulin-like protein 2 n=1 Tax=Tasmannia lanceolata TaxID=3420 RepID=UPI004063B3E1